MNTLLNNTFWTGYLSAVFGWITSFILPVAPFLSFTSALVLCDLYTGTRAARKRAEKIHSKGLKRTVEKLIVYFIAILLSEGMIRTFELPFNITYVVAFAIALTEFKSNIENIEEISGVNIWTVIRDRIAPPKHKKKIPPREEDLDNK